MSLLERSFHRRPPATVARELLGQRVLAPGPDGERVAVRIVETEAYGGPEDPASHARHGPDSQASRMFEAPGHAYVYVCYGIHQMLNVVAHAPGGVGAVLVRAGEPVEGVEAMRRRRGDKPDEELASGPGNLAEALGLTREAHDGVDLTEGAGLHLAEGTAPDPADVAVTGRVGVSEGGERLLRFVDRSSEALSRPAPGPSRGTADEDPSRKR